MRLITAHGDHNHLDVILLLPSGEIILRYPLLCDMGYNIEAAYHPKGRCLFHCSYHSSIDGILRCFHPKALNEGTLLGKLFTHEEL